MLCGGSSYVLVYTRGHWKYHRCRVCGLVSLYPRPSNEAILKSYDAYLPVARHEVECWAEMIKPVVDYSADLINRRNISGGRRLLDIGCGYGFFLKKMEPVRVVS